MLPHLLLVVKTLNVVVADNEAVVEIRLDRLQDHSTTAHGPMHQLGSEPSPRVGTNTFSCVSSTQLPHDRVMLTRHISYALQKG